MVHGRKNQRIVYGRKNIKRNLEGRATGVFREKRMKMLSLGESDHWPETKK
jgi:hypothetical protein